MTLLIAPIEALTDPDLGDQERRVLLALYSFRGKNTNTVWPKLDVLAERALINDKPRISKITKSLESKGWLVKKKRGFTGCNQYTLSVPQRLEKEPANLEESANLDDSANLVNDTNLVPDTNTNLANYTNTNLASDTKYREQTKEQTKEQDGRADSPTAIADRVIDYLNQTAGKKFRHTKTNRNQVTARLRDGFTEDDCIRVIDNRSGQWLGTEMDEFLRPSTLFRPSNFEGYLNAKPAGPRAGGAATDELID